MLTNTERQQIVEEVNAGTYGIDEALDDIAAAQKGEEVRKALYAEALVLNREGHAGSTDMGARQQIANLQTSVNGQISTLRTEVGDDIDDLETALNSGLATQNGRIAAQNATIANVVANYNVEYGSTELWASTGETGALAAGTTVTLSEDVSHFDYIDIYSFCGNSNVLDTVPVDAKLQSSQGYALRWVNLSDPGSGSYKAYVRIVETRLHIIGTTLTIDHQVTYRNGEEVNISGAEITQSNRSTYMGELGIMKIVGRKITANTEIEDVRIGADGTEYDSAGQAVRAQVTALESAIPAVDSTLSTQGAAADAKVAGDKVAELKSAIDAVPSINVYDKSANTNGKSIGSSGALEDNPQASVTDFIPVTTADNAFYMGAKNVDQFHYYAWYDSEKNLLGTHTMQAVKVSLNSIISSATAYCRFTVSNSSVDSFGVYEKRLATLDDLAGVEEKIERNTAKLSAVENKILSTANLLNTANNVPDTYIKQTTGVETPYTGWQSSEYIPIDSAEGYCLLIWNSQNWSKPSSVYYAFYNADKVYTHGNFTDATHGFVMQATAGDAYLRVSAQNANMSTSRPMVGKVSDLEGLVGDTDIGKYIPYGNTLDKDTLKVEFDNYVVENEAKLTEIDDNIKSVSIVLPSTVYIAVGRQFTFYKPNYLRCKNPDDYVCYWSTSLANTRFNEHIRFEPTIVGTYSATLFIMNRYNGETVAQKTISIVVVADTARTGKKVLFIGDSLTNAGFYPYEIQKHLSGEGVESIGTVTTTAYLDSDPAVTTRVSVNHEGRGGWSAQDYITKANKSGVVNAFWNPGTSAFDFNYYLNNNEYSLPDVVFVNLGTNGTANPTAEVNAIKTIINSIRARSATVPIVVSAIACGNATQDSYIDIYLTQIREKQLDEFDGKMNGVYVAPIYLNINRMTDWKTETVAESSRNQTEVVRQIDSVHPSKYGYFKFADVYWSAIQYIMGL